MKSNCQIPDKIFSKGKKKVFGLKVVVLKGKTERESARGEEKKTFRRFAVSYPRKILIAAIIAEGPLIDLRFIIIHSL